MNEEYPKRRSSFQFRLRTLLAGVLVLSLPLSWFAVRLAKARKQKSAVEAIELAGGEVTYEPYVLSIDFSFGTLGDDFYFDVVEVHSYGSTFGDDEAALLENLPNLTELVLRSASVTDAGLKHLKGQKLEVLDLDATRVTDAGLEGVKGMTDLVSLSLAGAQITDAGLEHFKGLINLEFLCLNGTRITDSGLEHLKEMTKLQWLFLADTEVTGTGFGNLNEMTELWELDLNGTHTSDVGLEHLRNMTLRKLHLRGTEVTDAGLENLHGVSCLFELDLTGTEITDAGLEHLRNITGLTWLSVDNTQVTQEGVARLRLALPVCDAELTSVP
jgi:internalin A